VYVVDVKTGQKLPVVIEKVTERDYEMLTEEAYWFDWRLEKTHQVYKLLLKEASPILGLISFDFIDEEYRIEIRLIAVAKEQKGLHKSMDRIPGNLLAHVGGLAFMRYGIQAALSLKPKTQLCDHYKNKYGFKLAGISLYLEKIDLFALIKQYSNDR